MPSTMLPSPPLGFTWSQPAVGDVAHGLYHHHSPLLRDHLLSYVQFPPSCLHLISTPACPRKWDHSCSACPCPRGITVPLPPPVEQRCLTASVLAGMFPHQAQQYGRVTGPWDCRSPTACLAYSPGHSDKEQNSLAPMNRIQEQSPLQAPLQPLHRVSHRASGLLLTAKKTAIL